MLYNFLTALIVTAYWTSYAVIGLGALLALQQWRERLPSSLRKGWSFVETCPLPVQFLLLTGVGWTVLVPAVLICYALSLPGIVITMAYVGALLAALVVGVVARTAVRAYARRCLALVRHESLFGTAVFIGMVLLIAIRAYKLGGYLADGTDSFVHMAKIAQIAYSHFTIGDPFLNGVVESRYHVNIFHALYAVPVRLSGLAVYEVWRQSLIFFGVLAYTSLCAILWYFLPRTWQKGYPYTIAALSFLLLASFWRTANYPNEVVLSWVVIYIIGLSRFVGRRDPVLLLVGATLIALTHPTYSLMALCFTALLFTAVLVLQRRLSVRYDRRAYAVGVGTLVLLALPITVSLLFPNRMTTATFNFMDTGVLSLSTYGPFTIMTLPVVIDHSTLPLVLMVLGLVGIVWLAIHAQERWQQLLIIALASFYGLIAYNPLFIWLFSGQLPTWLLQRFSYFDRLSTVTVVLGLTVMLVWVAGKSGLRRGRLAAVTAAAFLLLLPVIQGRLEGLGRQTDSQLTLLRSLAELRPSLDGQTVLAAQGLSFMVPSTAARAHVVWLPETNASPAANMVRRKQCGTLLMETLRQSDLQQAQVTRVLIGTWELDLLARAKASPYLHLAASNDQFQVYDVESLPGSTNGVCAMPAGQ